MLKISLCLITKNEAKNIRACLNSVKDAVDEMIVMDHHSNDETVEIAASYGARVFTRQWTKDFSAARNAAIEHATGDWIIFLDADEYFTDESSARIRELIERADSMRANAVDAMLTNIEMETGRALNATRIIRIFKNQKDTRYHGTIHESLVCGSDSVKIMDGSALLHIIHTGYSRSAVAEKNKAQRNLDLLRTALVKEPTNSDLLFYTSEAYLAANDFTNGLDFAKRAVEADTFKHAVAKEKNYLNMAASMRRLKYPEHEILQMLERATQQCPTPDLHFDMASLFHTRQQTFDAIEQYHLGLASIETATETQSNAANILDTAFFQMAELYRQTNRLHESVRYYIESLKSNRYHFASLQGLIRTLSHSESTESIAAFLRQLYPEGDLKSLLYQYRAALQSYNSALATYFDSLVDEQVGNQLGFEQAMLRLITRDYGGAGRQFAELWKVTNDEIHLIYAVAAAILGPDPKAELLQLQQGLTGELARFIDCLAASGNSETVNVKQLLQLWEVLIRLHESHRAQSLQKILQDAEALVPAAQIAINAAQPHLALELYHLAVNAGASSDDVLADVHTGMAVCCRNLQDWHLSREHCLAAQRLDPTRYQPYELLVQISMSNGNRDDEGIIREGLRRFPESSYLRKWIRQ